MCSGLSVKEKLGDLFGSGKCGVVFHVSILSKGLTYVNPFSGFFLGESFLHCEVDLGTIAHVVAHVTVWKADIDNITVGVIYTEVLLTVQNEGKPLFNIVRKNEVQNRCAILVDFDDRNFGGIAVVVCHVPIVALFDTSVKRLGEIFSPLPHFLLLPLAVFLPLSDQIAGVRHGVDNDQRSQSDIA